MGVLAADNYAVKKLPDLISILPGRRAQGLHAKWNFTTRRLNTRFDWTAIPRAWDTVNKSIQRSNCKLGSLIHMWRMTEHSASDVGRGYMHCGSQESIYWPDRSLRSV